MNGSAPSDGVGTILLQRLLCITSGIMLGYDSTMVIYIYTIAAWSVHVHATMLKWDIHV